jgi:hypothetical protein
MSIKRYSDFDHSNDDKTTYSNDSSKIKAEVKSVIIEKPIQIPIKEELLLPPKDTSGIEILEDKIIKFNGGHIKDILETIKTKYSNTDYYIRKKDNELHIVKYNESLKLNINEFVNTLLKFYSSKMDSNKITEGIKVKGNNNFSIIENMRPQYTNKFVDDLTKLLAKKNKE